MPVKKLSDRIAQRTPNRAGRNRASFLAIRKDIKEALDDGWPIKAVWETLHHEGKITFGYHTFTNYVKQIIRQAEAPVTGSKHEAPKADGFHFNPTPKEEDIF